MLVNFFYVNMLGVFPSCQLLFFYGILLVLPGLNTALMCKTLSLLVVLTFLIQVITFFNTFKKLFQFIFDNFHCGL